jgi:hypothetical protein
VRRFYVNNRPQDLAKQPLLDLFGLTLEFKRESVIVVENLAGDFWDLILAICAD